MDSNFNTWQIDDIWIIDSLISKKQKADINGDGVQNKTGLSVKCIANGNIADVWLESCIIKFYYTIVCRKLLWFKIISPNKIIRNVQILSSKITDLEFLTSSFYACRHKFFLIMSIILWSTLSRQIIKKRIILRRVTKWSKRPSEVNPFFCVNFLPKR